MFFFHFSTFLNEIIPYCFFYSGRPLGEIAIHPNDETNIRVFQEIIFDKSQKRLSVYLFFARILLNVSWDIPKYDATCPNEARLSM